MLTINAGYKTSSGNELSMTIYGQLYDRTDIPLFQDDQRLELCGSCKGVDGGCPGGGAPYFEQLKHNDNQFYVIVVQFDMAWAIQYGGVGKGIRQSNYFRSGYADRLTDLYIWRLVKYLEEAADAYGLGCGNCPVCTPKRCTVMADAKCAYPDRRRYSMEAVGVDCSTLHEELFGERLPYWYYTPELPRHMHRYAGLFVSDDIGELLSVAVRADKSYNGACDVTVPEYELVDLKVPEGAYDEGSHYLGYRPKS